MASITLLDLATGDFSALFEAFNSNFQNLNDDVSNLSAPGDGVLYLSEALDVEGSATIGGDLSIAGTLTITTLSPDILIVNDSANVSGTLSVGDAALFSADLQVADSARLSGTVNIEGSTTVCATLTILSALSAVDSVRASGEGVFGSAHVSTELLVAGSIVNSGTLHNENSAFFSNTLELFGSGNIHEFVSFGSAVNIASDFGLTAASVAQSAASNDVASYAVPTSAAEFLNIVINGTQYAIALYEISAT